MDMRGRQVGCKWHNIPEQGLNATLADVDAIFFPARADIKGDKVGSTGIEYLVIDPDTGLIKTAYRELNSLEFVYEVGQYICFQRHNQTRCAP